MVSAQKGHFLVASTSVGAATEVLIAGGEGGGFPGGMGSGSVRIGWAAVAGTGFGAEGGVGAGDITTFATKYAPHFGQFAH
jgi:hypothetical protein